jgi:eukaryotic-like serine/threonine-protein kinase
VSTTVFRQVGPYVIDRTIGHGGMASVFLATDSRSGQSVALKVVHVGSDTESREILEAEQRGAELQKRFSALSRFVPEVYDSGFSGDHFFIAMEYIAGEDLSHAISRGPLPPARAVAIARQICEFLDEADRFETSAASRRVLLHNDLKPRNIRVMDGDAIKVLDFGAAKSLSLSRKVTRNDFGSIAYLSPECLDTGERDMHSDAWALGVLLYEMVHGRQPFRAEDTRRLEQRIRSRRPPEAIDPACPAALRAIIAKLLAADPQDRYQSPAEIRADLDAIAVGGPVAAELAGWAREGDDLPTRRTRAPVEVDAATRATRVPVEIDPATRATRVPDVAPPPAAATTPAKDTTVIARTPLRRTRLFRWARNIAIAVFTFSVLNEGCVSSVAGRLANTVPLQDFAGLMDVWDRYDELADRSSFGVAVRDLERALERHSLVLAQRVFTDYRAPQPTVRENQWRAAKDALVKAVAVSSSPALRSALRYAEGHLLRIDGEARKLRRQPAQQQLNEAVIAFREAAQISAGWPDPFLGLARTFIVGFEDVELGADALERARALGHRPIDREIAQLADGYRLRGESLERAAKDLIGMPQEVDYLNRSAAAYKLAVEQFAKIAEFPNAATSLRLAQIRLERVELRLAEIKNSGGAPWE